MSLPKSPDPYNYKKETSIEIENNCNPIKNKVNSENSNSNNKTDYFELNIYNNIKQKNDESNTDITLPDNTKENDTVSNLVINNNIYNNYNNINKFNKSLNPKVQNLIYYDNDRNNLFQYPFTDNLRNKNNNNINDVDNNSTNNKDKLSKEIENNSAAPITPGFTPISKINKESFPNRKNKNITYKILKKEKKINSCSKICCTILLIILLLPIFLICLGLGGSFSTTNSPITCDDLNYCCKALCCCCCKKNKKKRKK